MFNEEFKYIKQDGLVGGNSTVPSVNMSSDIAIFNQPKFGVSATTKINNESIICDFQNVNFATAISSATQTCLVDQGISGSCATGITWDIRLSENNVVVYSADFYTTTSTASTPTTTLLQTAITTGYNSRGYDFTVKGGQYTLTKPQGVGAFAVDMCIEFDLDTVCTSGTCSADCTTLCSTAFTQVNSSTIGVHIVDGTGSTIPLLFDFTANTSTFTEFGSTFDYEIYKFNFSTSIFDDSPVISSRDIPYSSFSGTNLLNESISIPNLNIDGDYIVKGYFDSEFGTEFLTRMGVKHDTFDNKAGDEFGFYNKSLDYYFIVTSSAATPTFDFDLALQPPIDSLIVRSNVVISASTTVLLPTDTTKNVMIALNGLTLAEFYDYTVDYSAGTATFTGSTKVGDVLTYSFSSNLDLSTTVLANTVINVPSPIVSGITNAQGGNEVYYNTSTSMFEVYLPTEPTNDIIVILNGVSLANGIDYYRSISDTKRVILNGTLKSGDIINIFYKSPTQFQSELYTNTPVISWSIDVVPETTGGTFTIEVATGNTFTSLISSATTNYVVSQTAYSSPVTVNGEVNDVLFYRIKNNKKYITIMGDTIETIAFSETVPIKISTNAINSY